MVIILLLLIVLIPLLLLVVPASIYRTLGSWRQTLNWEASLLLASMLAYLGYFRVDEYIGPPIPLPAFLFWALKLLAIVSPACIAVAWLQWNGVQSETARMMFLLIPVGAFTIWLMSAFPFYMG
jgi:hypothetical protein